MRRTYIISLVLLSLLNFSTLKAQDENNEPDGKVLITMGKDTTRAEIVTDFAKFMSPLYRDPRLPAFTVVSRDKNYALGIGGYVRVTISQDFCGGMPSRDFVPYLINVPKTGTQRGHFEVDASTSKLFLRMLGNTRFGLVNVYIDTDFRGVENRYEFGSAYVNLNGFTFGRTWSIIADLKTFPPSSDYQGPNAFTGTFTTYVSYEKALSDVFSFGIAMELPEYSLPNPPGYNTDTIQTVPTVPIYLQLENYMGHVRFSTLLRTLRYKNLYNNDRSSLFTWAALFSSRMFPFPKTTFYMQAVYGRGISDYIFDINSDGLDAAFKDDQSGELVPLPLFGFFGSVKYDFTDKVQMSATYSQMRLYKRGVWGPDRYKLGQYITATLYYSLTPKLVLATEYNYGRRENLSTEHASANRVQATLRYDF